MSVKAINVSMGELIYSSEDWPMKNGTFPALVVLAIQGEWSGDRIILVNEEDDLYDSSEYFDDVTRKYEGRLISFLGGVGEA